MNLYTRGKLAYRAKSDYPLVQTTVTQYPFSFVKGSNNKIHGMFTYLVQPPVHIYSMSNYTVVGHLQGWKTLVG